MQISTLSFSSLNTLAVGVSAKVDLYSMRQPESQDDADFEDFKPQSTIQSKFDEAVSAL